MILKPLLRCLAIFVILCFVAREHQAEINHLASDQSSYNKHIIRSDIPTQFWSTNVPSRPKDNHSKQLGPQQFIIATTGNAIRLYPFVGQRAGDKFQNLSQHHYLLRPLKLISSSSDSYIRKYGNNTLARYLFEEANQNRRPNNSKRLVHFGPPSVGGSSSSTSRLQVSILPQGLEEEYNHNNSAGYKRPLITDVDYFLDDRFCGPDGDSSPAKKPTCLVVVWLDGRNRLVRFGSLNLTRIINHNQGSKSMVSIAWLDEFKPLDLNTYSIVDRRSNKSQQISLVVDRRRLRLHLAFGSEPKVGRSQLFLNHVLSAEFTVNYGNKKEENTIRIDNIRILSGLNCSGSDLSRSHIRQEATSFSNIALDEETGDWLYYFNHDKIRTAFVGNYEQLFRELDSLSDNLEERFHSDSVNLVETEIRLNLDQSPLNLTGAVTFGSGNARIYWITQENKLMSSDYIGGDIRVDGLLPKRPRLLDPILLHQHGDIFYVSDRIKKLIVAYKVIQDRTMGQSGNQSANQEPIDAQYILVSSSPILGFKMIDLDRRSQESGSISGIKLNGVIEPLKSAAASFHFVNYDNDKFDYRLIDDHEIKYDKFISPTYAQLAQASKSVIMDDFDPIEALIDLSSSGDEIIMPRSKLLGVILQNPSNCLPKYSVSQGLIQQAPTFNRKSKAEHSVRLTSGDTSHHIYTFTSVLLGVATFVVLLIALLIFTGYGTMLEYEQGDFPVKVPKAQETGKADKLYPSLSSDSLQFKSI